MEATAEGLLRWINESNAMEKKYIGPSAAKALTDIKGESHPMRAAGKDHLRRNYEDALCIPVLTGTG